MSRHYPKTFRFSEHMLTEINAITEARSIDRSSVIRLALYLLGVYMRREDVRRQTLPELVAALEALAPEDYPDFGSFSEE